MNDEYVMTPHEYDEYIDGVQRERDAAIARAEKAEARVTELEEQIERGYIRRRCANLKCPDESFMPSRIDQQYCGKRCRDAHGQRVSNQRKRLRQATTSEPTETEVKP